jgi:hypothetical protein
MCRVKTWRTILVGGDGSTSARLMVPRTSTTITTLIMAIMHYQQVPKQPRQGCISCWWPHMADA